MKPEDATHLIFRVRRVKPHDTYDDKETVFLETGMTAFTADAGTYEQGDYVAVTNDDEKRAVGRVPAEVLQ